VRQSTLCSLLLRFSHLHVSEPPAACTLSAPLVIYNARVQEDPPAGCTALQRGALTPAEVCEALGMMQLKNRRWHVQGAVATKGEGLYEGLDWLSNTLKTMQRSGVNTSVNALGR
jgi:hypothetical protein